MIEEKNESNYKRKFYNPASKNGVWLAEIIKRLMVCIKSIYTSDNVDECKLRLYKIVKPLLSKQERKEAQEILNRNIVCADALTYDYSFK